MAAGCGPDRRGCLYAGITRARRRALVDRRQGGDRLSAVVKRRGASAAIMVDNGDEFVRRHGCLGVRARRGAGIHTSRQTGGECLHLEPQRPLAGRMLERTRLRLDDGSAADSRGLGSRTTMRSARRALCRIGRPTRCGKGGATHVRHVSRLESVKIEWKPRSQVASTLFRRSKFAGRVSASESFSAYAMKCPRARFTMDGAAWVSSDRDN